eukprot:7007271-Lingulodinium_polyedra.AAC.1
MWVAGVVLAKPHLQSLTRLISTLLTPLYDAHARHARECRSPDAILQFYLGSSCGDYMSYLREMLQLLSSGEAMARVGLDTDFAVGVPVNLPLRHPKVKEQDWLAGEVVGLALGLLRH